MSKWSPRTGLTLRLGGDHRGTVQAGFVLDGHALHVPVATATDGLSRSPADGSSVLLAWAVGAAFRMTGEPGRAFQARDRWGHIRVTNDRTAADNTGHYRPTICPAQQPTPGRRRKSPRSPQAPSHGGSQGFRCPPVFTGSTGPGRPRLGSRPPQTGGDRSDPCRLRWSWPATPCRLAFARGCRVWHARALDSQAGPATVVVLLHAGRLGGRKKPL
jgi:hypothetical protein